MKLYLIRHGRQNSRLCNVNVDLCEEGYRQAALLGERLFPKKIQAVYSSDLLRAVETAQAANLYWNVEHTICPELREIDFGEMEGEFALANRIPLIPVLTALACLFLASFVFELGTTHDDYFIPARVLAGLGAICFTLFSIVSILESGTSSK